MKLFDFEIPTELSGTVSNVFDSFVKQQLDKAGIVKMGPAPAGNLSAEQIAQGQRGGQAPIQSANNSGLMNSLGFGMSGSNGMIMAGALVAFVGVAAFLILKK